MQTLQDTTAIIENDALQTAINPSNDSNYVRGTKRMRVGSEETQNQTEAPQAGRLFFETKWDSEAARKKRKCLGWMRCTRRITFFRAKFA